MTTLKDEINEAEAEATAAIEALNAEFGEFEAAIQAEQEALLEDQGKRREEKAADLRRRDTEAREKAQKKIEAAIARADEALAAAREKPDNGNNGQGQTRRVEVADDRG